MKISAISLTGADDKTNVADLLDISQNFPIVEWGILFSNTRAGTTRYPSANFINELHSAQATTGPRPMKLAGHLCGKTMRAFMKGITFEHYDDGAWLAPHELTSMMYNQAFQRTQVNFNANREKFTKDDLTSMMRGWYESMDGCIITQHHNGNPDVWEWCQAFEHETPSAVRAHQVLHDASGGNSVHAAQWNKPIAGMPNGFAGGLGPANVIETLIANEDTIGDGVIWIDMEGSLRNEADDTFDIEKAQRVIDLVLETGLQRNWLL